VDQPSPGHSHGTHCCLAQWDPQWHHLLRNRLLKSSREQHFTVVLLANAHPNAYISCSPIIKLHPLFQTTCLLLSIKKLTSCISRDINLSKTARCHRSLRILPHKMSPASRKQLKRPMLRQVPDPQPLPSSLLN
jgi:hypothetical protein